MNRVVPKILKFKKDNSNIRDNALIVYMQQDREKTYQARSVSTYTVSEVGEIVSALAYLP